MPNYVVNILKIRKLHTPAQYAKAIRELTSNEYNDKDILTTQYMDFNKIIPEPKTKEECPDKYILPDDDKSLSHDDGKDWFDWYNWRLDNWGTKWNTCDNKIIYNSNSLVLLFTTAWSCPKRVLYKLAKMGYEFEWDYADEDTDGNNSGQITCEQIRGSEAEIHEEHEFNSNWMDNLWDDYYNAPPGGSVCK